MRLSFVECATEKKLINRRCLLMIKLHPKILEKDGKKEFAVIPYEELMKIQEDLDDYESLKALREAKTKEANAKTVSLKEAKKILDIE
jgi:hypothetical protein